MDQLKEKRFRLESEIISTIFKDNSNTVHFDYHVNIDEPENGIRLDLYTKNAKNHVVFLFHQTSGQSSIDVLQKMIDYLQKSNKHNEKNSYTVKWKANSEDASGEHVSYFFEANEADVRKKFFYNKKEEDYTIQITQNPLS